MSGCIYAIMCHTGNVILFMEWRTDITMHHSECGRNIFGSDHRCKWMQCFLQQGCGVEFDTSLYNKRKQFILPGYIDAIMRITRDGFIPVEQRRNNAMYFGNGGRDLYGNSL